MIAGDHIYTPNNPNNQAFRQTNKIRGPKVVTEWGPHWSKYIRRISSSALGVRDVGQGTTNGRLNL
jgi:hypothetical protein